MIDFTGVKAITIPEGSVKKITRGSEVLWEKPISSIVVFNKSVSVFYSGKTIIMEDIKLSRQASTGEKYIIYINGDSGHTATVTYTQYLLTIASDDGAITLQARTAGNTPNDTFAGNLQAQYSGTVALEIHYLPE